MKVRASAVLLAACLLTACGGGGGAASAIPPPPQNGAHATPTPGATSPPAALIHSCPPASPGTATCYALIRIDSVNLTPMVRRFLATRRNDSSYAGPLRPTEVASVYRLPANYAGSTAPTIAIVDAYDDPSAEVDLTHYRNYFALPNCTSANGCFHKINEHGASNALPTPDAGWTGEISLDLDAVSAACPACHITLIEAASNNWSDLNAAEDTAAAMNPAAISNSFGGAESQVSDGHFTHPNTVIIASTGDNSYYGGPQQPASFASVVAVGGTALYRDSGSARGWDELAWANTGSGCSAIVPRPAWQNASVTGCANRAESDISAFADPFNPGIWVWNTYTGGAGNGGWYVDGGTSAAAPLVASMYGLANNSAILGPTFAQSIWNDAGRSMFDVTQGNNGYCSPLVLCSAGPGYDGPTGWGSPSGQGAI